VAVEVDPVSFSAASLACSTHIAPSPFFAAAAPAVGAAITQAAARKRIKRRMTPHFLSR